MVAAWRGNLSFVRYLILKGADIALETYPVIQPDGVRRKNSINYRC